MGRGGKTFKQKVIKQNIGGDEEAIGDLFNQLLGNENSLDINIVKDKYNRLYANINRIKKLCESFVKTIYIKALSGSDNKDKLVDVYIKNMNGFIDDCKFITDAEIEDSGLIRYYLQLKETKTIKEDCIHICRSLIIFKKYIQDIDNLDDSFIKSSKTKELQIFPFCNFDIKYFYVMNEMDESIKKYILIYLNMMYNTTYDIYNIITSPDIDISKFSEVIVNSIAQAKKMIPRANKAFKKIEESVDLLQNNFSEYYKDFITTKDPSTIITSFIGDCSKSTISDDNIDLDLIKQFKRISMFYKNKSAGKIKDPRVNQIFEMLDKNFDMLNVTEKDISDEEVDEEVKADP